MANDILIDNPFRDGDFNIGPSDAQHVQHLLAAHPGHYKGTPWIGIGALKYLGSPMDARTAAVLEREVKLHLQSDGAKKIKVVVNPTSKDVNIDAVYD